MRITGRFFLLLAVAALAALFSVPPPTTVNAQGAGDALELTKSVEGGLTEIETGQTFVYILRYRCVGVQQNCNDVSVSDVLPPELSWAAADVQMFGSIHTTALDYDEATGTATWTFVNPLPGGSTGELRIEVQFPNGVTPDGTIATNDATISASNTSPGIETTPPVDIEAQAQSQMTLTKTLLSGGSPDQNVTYQISLCRPPGNVPGQLNMSGITLTDTLQPGATFVAASGGGTYSAGPPQTVSWTLPDYDVNTSPQCVNRTVTVRYDSANGFADGDSVTNTAEATGTPVGEPPVTLTDDVTHTLVGQQPGTLFQKNGSRNTAAIGESVRYGFRIRNSGTVDLQNYTITDLIPDTLNVTEIHMGNRASPTLPLTVRYQTANNPVYTALPGSPFTAGQVTVTVASLGLAPGDYVTALEWSFATLPVGFNNAGSIPFQMGFTATILPASRSGVPVVTGQVIRNTGSFSYVFGGSTTTGSDFHDVTVSVPAAEPVVAKSVIGNTSVNPGSVITYQLEVGNDAAATTDLPQPVFADLLDSDVTFVSWSYNAGPSAAPQPMFEQIDNYNGTGRTLLRWFWTGATAYTFAPGETVFLEYTVQTLPGTPPGANRVTNRGYLVDWDMTSVQVDCDQTADINDLDGDGITAEQICQSNEVNVGVNSLGAMQSIKYARGELDADWVTYPEQGRIFPGSFIDYRVVLDNVGNVPVTDIVVVDILPYVGDTGVINTAPRNSVFQPVLVAPVNAPGGVVEYSVEGNPCRPQMVPTGPVGCDPPNWSSVPPADLTTVRALRISFNAVVLDPLDSLEIIWRMRAPINVSPADTVFNSFAFTAVRTDTGSSLLPTEPIAVGTQVISYPLVGSKRVVEVNETGITFSLAWMNTNNPGPVRARITDNIPAGTSFAAGSLACDARGASTTTRCEFEPAANRIVWEGYIAPDPGITDPEVAQNEIFIMLRVIPEPGVTEVTNQADSTIDTDDDGDFTDEPSTTPSDEVTWTPETGPPSLEITKLAAPFIAGPGDEVTWTIAVTNRSGFAPAYNVSVSDNVPDAVTIIGVSASQGTYTFTGRSYSFEIGTIGPNVTVLINIRVRVREDIETPVLITNVAVLSVGDQVIETTQSSIVRVTQLPETGQSPYSEARRLLLGMLTWGLISAAAGTVVLSLAGRIRKLD